MGTPYRKSICFFSWSSSVKSVLLDVVVFHRLNSKSQINFSCAFSRMCPFNHFSLYHLTSLSTKLFLCIFKFKKKKFSYSLLLLLLFLELTNCTILPYSHKINFKYNSQFNKRSISYNWPSCLPLASKVSMKIKVDTP